MEYTLEQILDIPLLQSLQDKLNAINPFPSALIDNSGKILTATAWQDICTKFHRVHPESEKECIISDQYILSHIQEADPAVSYKCPHGLVDNATPIIVDGQHMANFFTGQFFLEPPDPVRIDDQVYGIEGFILDSTRLKIAELERDLSRTRLASVFEKMTEGFALHEIICDADGKPVDYRFLDVNPAFARLTDLNPGEIIGRRVKEIMPGLEDSWIERYGTVALTGIPVTFDNYAAFIKRHFRVVAFSNQQGQFATIFDDITDLIQSEEKLRTLAKAIDSIKECVSMTDTSNNILFVNKAFCTNYGYSAGELIGQNISIVRSPTEPDILSTEILTETIGGGWSGEAMNRRKDGTDFPVYISTAVVEGENKQILALIGIAVDITERKKSEQELVLAKERAEESDRLKSAFLANISHEIRTPMNSILGFSELLEEIVDDPVQLGYLKIISHGGERLLNIINSVIDIAKIEAGQEDVNPVQFDVNSLLTDLYELNKRRNPGVKFTNDMDSQNSMPLYTDKTKLFQILNNLLSNALKYTKKGSVRFGYRTHDGFITFYVKDTGIGIPAEFNTKIFKRFQKVDFKGRTEFEGTGLGLAITSELVKMLKGEIWFDSVPEKGTTFFVKFPV